MYLAVDQNKLIPVHGNTLTPPVQCDLAGLHDLLGCSSLYRNEITILWLQTNLVFVK